MEYLPITLALKDKKCLIIGGGDIAARKLITLLRAKAEVDVVSSDFNDEFLRVKKKHDLNNTVQPIKINITEKETVEKMITHEYSLIIAATDNPLINRMVSVVAKRQNVLVNVVDSLELSSFIFPAIIDRSPLLVAVSTTGVSPLLARKIRERIEWILPKNLGSIFSSLRRIREALKRKRISFRDKKDFLEEYIDSQLNEKEIPVGYHNPISKLVDIKQLSEIRKEKTGKVYLVGAGPGDPELLTIKALKLLQRADVVFYDSLIPETILELIRRDAKTIHVGKRASNHSMSQQEINHHLVNSVKEHTVVVRLKGGDPFIFGRGGEELQALAKHNIKFEVIPGITAASGCASYAGIPLTHRDYSQSVHFVTAHQQNSVSSVDWKSLVGKKQTLVFYMGLLKNKILSEQLVSHGLDANTPIAVIENGTRVDQRVVTGKIGELPELVQRNKITMPALIIVGEVVALEKKLSWFNKKIKPCIKPSMKLNTKASQPKSMIA